MFTLSKRSILGLVLCTGMVGAVASQSATSLAAIPEPVMEATLQSQTLHVTGTNFSPGGKVSIALVNTQAMKLVARGSTYAQDALLAGLCPNGHEVCTRPNPKAGTISYTIHLKRALSASDLELLYRSAGKTGSQSVKDLAQTASPPRQCGGVRAACILP